MVVNKIKKKFNINGEFLRILAHSLQFNGSKVFGGAIYAESCSNDEYYPKNLMRIIPTKGEKQ